MVVPVHGKVLVCPSRILDISRGGIRLSTDIWLEPGTTVRIFLETVLEGRVIHACAKGPSAWALHCAFTEEITASAVQRLLCPP
jgi:hypothetical protein